MSLQFDLSSLTKKLSELEKKVQKDVAKKALLAGAEPMEKSIKNASPIDTGELKNNIQSAKKVKVRKGKTTIDVGVTGDNRKIISRAYYSHYGARSKAPTYFMDDGFKKGLNPAQEKMIEVLKKELK